MNAITIEDSLSEDLFEALGAGDMSEQDKALLLIQMIEIVQTRVLDKVYEMIGKPERDHLVELMESENVNETEEYLLHTVPGYSDMFEQEAKTLRRELVGRMVAA